MLNKLPLLPIIAFISGFSLLVFELAAARILAPSIGSSTYVWTSVIGVIIASLSIGYWVGGKWADARARILDIVWICLAAAGTITLVLITYMSVLEWTVESIDDARVQGVVASLLLFAPTSFLIGALSPYLVKLRITSLKTSGQSFASLSALESIGGITGTFITGFILFGFIGARETFAVVVFLLLATSWLVTPSQQFGRRLAFTGIIAFFCIASLQMANGRQIDTASAHYSILEGTMDGERVRGVATGPNGTQSGISLEDPDKLIFWYTKQMAEVVAAAPNRDNILILGGGAFTLPQSLATTYPESQIDVVEIDPELAGIAREYFNYRDPQNVNLIFEDARTYINRATTKYDIILIDVYSDASVPFSLMTKEYGQNLRRLVAKDGIVAANLIAGLSGPCGELLGALDSPYRDVFSRAVYTIQRPYSPRSNIIVVYSDKAFAWRGAIPLDRRLATSYTDNYTPAEQLQESCHSSV